MAKASIDYEADENLIDDNDEVGNNDNDNTLSDSDEEIEQENVGNTYEYDGFVVPDDYDEETEEFEGTEGESVERGFLKLKYFMRYTNVGD